MRCIILSAGEFTSFENLGLNLKSDDIIICADAGYKHAKRLGIKPILIMGDFDSYFDELPTDIAVKRFEIMKDDTDTMLAIKEGIAKGADEFILLGSLGGRLDHSFANIQSLAYLVDKGYKACILSDTERVYIIKNAKIEINKCDDFALSVFSYSNISYGVSLEGLVYSLFDGTITQNFPIGVSNKFKDDVAKISVKDGTLLIMVSKLVNL